MLLRESEKLQKFSNSLVYYKLTLGLGPLMDIPCIIDFSLH